MTKPGERLLAGLAPTHPGELLREDMIPASGLSRTEIARRLHVSPRTLFAILGSRRPVTPTMALKLGALFGNSAESWLNMQRDYDLRMLRPVVAAELAAIKRL